MGFFQSRRWSNPTRVLQQQEADNGARDLTLFQAFEWHVPADQKHWRRLRAVLPDLKDLGINQIWLPPACKASSGKSNGYDCYDLYDLGEFDWKMSRATKWGLKEELVALAHEAQAQGLGLLWDAVLNHKAAADFKETVTAVEVDPADRTKEISAPKEIEAWVGFNFPGRQGKYSGQEYHSVHFSGVDYDAKEKNHAIYRFANKHWAEDVDDGNGNFDYLMFSNLDYSNEEVVRDVGEWGRWVAREVPLQGMRLDAVRHISRGVIQRFLRYVREEQGANFFFVGEYWKDSLSTLRSYLAQMSYSLCLFDVPLVYNLARVSKTANADLRTILHGTLVNCNPEHAVTCVSNHDTQLGQTMSPGATVEQRFLTNAYALILLRAHGIPCVFYGDLYGTQGAHAQPPVMGLPLLCRLRRSFAKGCQRDYFDQPHCIGWTREGDDRTGNGCGLAVVMSNYPLHDRATWSIWARNRASTVTKRMCVGAHHAGESWIAVYGDTRAKIRIDGNGFGQFLCPRDGLTIWVNEAVEGIGYLNNFNSDIYSRI